MEWVAIVVACAALALWWSERRKAGRHQPVADGTSDGTTEDRFTKFFEEVPLPMYRSRRDGTIVHANRALAKMLAIEDPLELAGTNASRFYIDPAEREAIAEIQEETGVVEHQITALRATDGRTVWVRDSSHTIDDGDGPVFEGALVDVTVEHVSTQELRLRATQHEALAHIAQTALRSTDVGEVLQEAVSRICAVVGADCAAIAQEQEGHGLVPTAVGYGLDSSAERERVIGYVTDRLAVPRGDDAVALETDSDLSGIAIGLTSPDRPHGVLVVAGSAFAASTEDLNFLKTTAATLGSALLRSWARDQLSSLIRSKDEFVASVSHELRTPLTVVAGLAFELEEKWRHLGEAELAEFISLIADQSREMGDLIEDLLVAARADIGKVPIYPELTDLRACADQVVASCALADRARISVVGNSTIANVDPVRCRQIMRNLITNAIRYGGPLIRVGLETDGDEAVLSVYDDGVGIAEQDRDKIFTAYERGHTAVGVPGSVGLGLTVSQMLTELMNGSISYRYDSGSHFEVRLPVAAATAG